MKIYWIIAMAVIGLSLGGNICQAQEKVLVIHSYDQDLDWTKQCNRGISGVLADTAALEFVYLDTKRIPESAFRQRADEAMETFRRFAPDVVMLGDDNALRLLGPMIGETGTRHCVFRHQRQPSQLFSADAEKRDRHTRTHTAVPVGAAM